MALLILTLVSIGFVFALASLVGGMAQAGPTSRWLARKVFHMGVFSGAVPAQLLLGFWGVTVYGSVVSGLVLMSHLMGPELSFHRGLSRASEDGSASAPVLGPLMATALGGLMAVSLVGPFATVGYLVCGWGDALGEWVGGRWGRHRYPSPFSGSPHGEERRSIEGSLAVFLAGSLGALVALSLLAYPYSLSLPAALACGGIGAAAEGVSSRGADNFWVQILPSLMAWWLLV